MTDGELLLRSVLLAPDDNTPRLVYADWLDEHGDPERAEFIRVQCELVNVFCRRPGHNAGTSTGMQDPMKVWRHAVDELRRRERELWKSPEAGTWFGDDFYISIGRSLFGRGGDGRKPSALIHSGFVSEVRLPLAAFVGVPCGRCNGNGLIGCFVGDNVQIPVDYAECECPDCSGTGRVGGVAKGLFERHPITFVSLPDVPPAVTSGLSSHPDSPYFGFGPEVGFTNGNPHNRLPPPLFDLMEGYMTGLSPFFSSSWRSPFFSSSWRFYPTRAAALAALSDACVAYGRSQVDWLSEHDAKKELASVAI